MAIGENAPSTRTDEFPSGDSGGSSKVRQSDPPQRSMSYTYAALICDPSISTATSPPSIDRSNVTLPDFVSFVIFRSSLHRVTVDPRLPPSDKRYLQLVATVALGGS